MFALNFLIKNHVRKKAEKISSFEKINLFISGMRFSCEYEIINKGEKKVLLMVTITFIYKYTETRYLYIL